MRAMDGRVAGERLSMGVRLVPALLGGQSDLVRGGWAQTWRRSPHLNGTRWLAMPEECGGVGRRYRTAAIVFAER